MIQNILRHLGGVEQYGIISLCLFGAMFLGVLVFTFLQRRSYVEHMARVPLDLDPEDPSKPRELP